MFAAFGDDLLEWVDSTTSPQKLSIWKSSEKTKNAYASLFTNHQLLSKIGYTIFKQLKEDKLPLMHCTYLC